MGGNVFKGKTQSIKKENIDGTVHKYFEELKKVFPNKADIFNHKYFKYVGSVGKKPLSGDIDFAIDVSTIIDENNLDISIKQWNLNPDNVKLQFHKFKKRARTATDSEIMIRAMLKGIVEEINANAPTLYCDEKKITPSNIFGLFPQYENNKKMNYGVQIDWMIGDMELLQFSYYSEVYHKGYKGLHRTQLLLSMFNYYGYSFNHTKGLSDKKTKKFLTKNPKEMINYLEEFIGISLSEDITKNYFKLIKILDKISNDDRDEILNIYFNILGSTRVDIPKNLQNDWKRLTKIHNYQTKFLPADSKLLSP